MTRYVTRYNEINHAYQDMTRYVTRYNEIYFINKTRKLKLNSNKLKY